MDIKSIAGTRVLDFARKNKKNGKTYDIVLLAPADTWRDSQTWQRISHLKPKEKVDDEYDGLKNDEDSRAAQEALWAIVSPLYEAWLQKNETPLTRVSDVAEETAAVIADLQAQLAKATRAKPGRKPKAMAA